MPIELEIVGRVCLVALFAATLFWILVSGDGKGV